MEHTVLENVKFTADTRLLDLSAANESNAFAAAGARGNAVIVVPPQAAAADGSNYPTLSLEESEDGTAWNPVANGANGGAEVCVMIGRTNGEDVYRDANGQLLSSVDLNDEVDANGAGENLIAGVWVLEYLGRAKYFRVKTVATGTVAAEAQVLHAQNALNILPNIVDAG